MFYSFSQGKNDQQASDDLINKLKDILAPFNPGMICCFENMVKLFL